MPFKLLVINPGSTSLKIAVFTDEKLVLSVNEKRESSEEHVCGEKKRQLNCSTKVVKDFLKRHNFLLSDFNAIVARGGLLRPISSGTYLINSKMIAELLINKYGWHAANEGAIIAWQLAEGLGLPAYIVDPVVVDELCPVARVTGRPDMPKRSIFHALNQKAMARKYAQKVGKSYQEIKIVVAHLGGGISVGCHYQGKVIEVNNGLNGEGPFSPNRLGTVQAKAFFELIKNNDWDSQQINEILMGQSGIIAYLGTDDMREVESMVTSGEEKANLLFTAMAYQTARYIAAATVAAQGEVEQIILTGGIAHSRLITDKITSYINFIAPVTVFPGEDEMQALTEGALRVLRGEEKVLTY